MRESSLSNPIPDRLQAQVLVPLLLLIFLLATVVRVYALGRPSLWQDELVSVECSTGRGWMQLPSGIMFNPPPRLTSLTGALPWWTIWGSMSSDNHPPLYFVLLRFWRELFGDSEVAMRGLSVVISLTAIGLFFDAVRQSSGDATALWTAGMMAMAGGEISIAQTVRGYALLSAFGALACAAIIRIEHKGCNARRLFALGTACLSMVATHYYGAVPVAVIGLYAIIRFKGMARRRVLVALSITAGLGIIFVGPVLLSQLHAIGNNNAWGIERAAGHVQRTLIRVLVLPVRLVSEPGASHIPLPFLAGLAYLLPLPLLRWRRDLLFWYLWFVAPVFFVASLDLARHSAQLYEARYTAIAGPALFVLIAAIVPRKWGKLRLIPPALAVLLCFCSLPFCYSPFWLDCRELAANLQTKAQPSDKIILAATSVSSWNPSPLCVGITYYRYPPTAPVLLLSAPPTDSILKQLKGSGRIWLVCSPGTSPEDVFPGAEVLQSQTLKQGGVFCEVVNNFESESPGVGTDGLAKSP